LTTTIFVVHVIPLTEAKMIVSFLYVNDMLIIIRKKHF